MKKKEKCIAHIVVKEDTKRKFKALCGFYGYTYDECMIILMEKAQKDAEFNKEQEIEYVWNQHL